MLVMGRESSIPERNIVISDNFSISVNLLQIKFIYACIMFISMNLFAFDVLLDFILKKIHAIGKITVFFLCRRVWKWNRKHFYFITEFPRF